MAANYNNSAWFYDGLSRLVFGRALIDAQVYLLQYIPLNSHILIAGGGTGWILEEIGKVHPSDLTITYVEVSAKMMEKSKKRFTGKNRVIYINSAIENVTMDTSYDVIITPFLLDNFTTETLQKVFDHLHTLLKPNGLWLNTDFQLSGIWWQKVFINAMLLFFKSLCRIEASQLPDIEKQFKQNNYKVIAIKTFFNGFVISKVYSAPL